MGQHNYLTYHEQKNYNKKVNKVLEKLREAAGSPRWLGLPGLLGT